MRSYLPFFIFFILVCACTLVAKAEDNDSLAVRLIPAALLKDANAVVRAHHVEVRIASINEVFVKERIAITILNEKGARHAELNEGYDKLNTILSQQAWLYDPEGNQIGKMKKSDVKDIGRVSVNFFDDARYKLFEFNYSSYPYTVVFETEEKCEYSFHLPAWLPQNDYDYAVEHADVAISYPQGMQLRYKAAHIDGRPSVITDGDQQVMTMSVTGLPAFSKPDELTPVPDMPYPSLRVAIDHFGLQGYEGSMATWQQFGTFFYELNKDRDNLPEDKRKLIHRMVDTCHTPAQKITLLYEYLKQETRYVGIQLGIGGWQTFMADFVSEKGYGDCKALSNYMKALLKEAGITAYQALVYAGEPNERPMQLDFPYNVFDHVILCVPQKDDTVWLECTAKNLPAGYLSSFTDDRNVLLLTPAGGVVVRTPRNADSVNTLSRKALLAIDDNNEALGAVDATYKGCMWEQEAGQVNNRTKTDVDKHMNRSLALPTYNVAGYKVDNGRGRVPVLNEHIAVTATGLSSKSGKRLFPNPQVFRSPCESPDAQAGRQGPFELYQSYLVTDTVLLHLPGAYTPTTLPRPAHAEYAFGDLNSQVLLVQNNILMVVTTYRQKKGVYTADQFIDFMKFCDQANSGLGDIVLTKND